MSRLKAFVDVPLGGVSSRSMHRVARELRLWAPPEVECVAEGVKADIQILHVIGRVLEEDIQAPRFAMIQYCYQTAGQQNWLELWERALGVWSYYDLRPYITPKVPFYFAPLGVNRQVFQTPYETFSPKIDQRQYICMTSGFVNGPKAEAIEEVADAALELEEAVIHLGPYVVEGMKPRREKSWNYINEVSDRTLAAHYQASKYVSGLRHVEGFELPVLEGFACGARPIVFDREETQHWFGNFAIRILECSGPELVRQLVDVFKNTDWEYIAPRKEEIDAVLRFFDWRTIVSNFWKGILA